MVLYRSGFALLTLLCLAGHAAAGTGVDSDAGGKAVAESTYVEKTVCVPEWVTEKRTVTCTEYTQETREKLVTVCRQVPVTKWVEQQYTVMVPETRMRTVTSTVCKPVYETRTCQVPVRVPVWNVVEQHYTCRVPVYRDEQRTYTVMVPHCETRTGTRTVCKVVQEQQTKTVTCDEGHWETCVEEVPCGGTCCARRCCRVRAKSCCGCSGTRTVCRQVWVPNLVTKEVPVTVCRKVMVEEPYEYTVTVCKPETRTCTVRVCDYKCETRVRKVRVCSYRCEMRTKTYQVCRMVPHQVTRQVPYTVCVPQIRTRKCAVTTCETVQEQKKVAYTVCVPRQVEKEVEVCVCRMVEKTIQVPACEPCCDGCQKAPCLLRRRGGC